MTHVTIDPLPAPTHTETAAPAASVPVARELFPLDQPATPAPAVVDEKAELNILPPERQKTVPAQTWESDGFRPAREPRNDRPRRDERAGGERRDEAAPIPSKFRYERAKDGPLPPREVPSPYAKPAASAPKKSGGFLGWLKSLFGGSAAAKPAVGPAQGESRQGDREGGNRHRRHRGGRGRGQYQQGGQGGNYGGNNYGSQGGDQSQGGGEGRSQGGEYRGEGRGDGQGEGFRRRRRGGRNRGGQFRSDRREGGGGQGGGAPQGN
ncbi:MAG: hypothetical protein ACHQ5A_11980 [Opitutales bacterium]